MIAGTLPFPFGVSEFTTKPWTFEEDVDNFVRLGVRGMELCEEKLHPRRWEEQLALVRDAQLPIMSVQPMVRTMLPSTFQPQPSDRGERLARFHLTIERIAPYAPGAAFISQTGPPPGGDIAGTIDRMVTDHRQLAAIAADHDVRIALEPLSPTMVNVETAIWTFAQALEVVQAIGRDNVGVCLDLWNLWQDADLPTAIAPAADRIFLLQVADWRTPRSFADRRSVGTGQIPFPLLLPIVYNSGYRGPCVLEILSENVPDSLYDGDLFELVRSNRAALDEAWPGP